MGYPGEQRHCAKADSLGRVAGPAHIGVLLPKIFSRTRLHRVTRSPQRSRVVDVGDYTQVSLKGRVSSMASSNARKRAARDYQRQFPGTPYPVALRAVTPADDRLTSTFHELAGDAGL